VRTDAGGERCGDAHEQGEDEGDEEEGLKRRAHPAVCCLRVAEKKMNKVRI